MSVEQPKDVANRTTPETKGAVGGSGASLCYPSITMTGVDVRTNLTELPAGCEIGVLYTETPEGRNRYASWGDTVAIVEDLALLARRIAIHVCGSKARRRLIDGELTDITALAERIQVNGRLEPYELERICDRYDNHQIITQGNDWNRCLIDVDATNHAILVDASGGRGKSPRGWKRPETYKPVGFAGGIGPDNIREELRRIRAVAVGEWWIDMEGKLRDQDDWFDVSRARAVVAALDG